MSDGGLTAGIIFLEEARDSDSEEERIEILSALVSLKSAYIMVASPSEDQNALLENLNADVEELVGIVGDDEAYIAWSAYCDLLRATLCVGQRSLLESVAEPALNFARMSISMDPPTDSESREIRDSFLHHVALTACVLGETELLEAAYNAIARDQWIRDKHKNTLLDAFAVKLPARFAP